MTASLLHEGWVLLLRNRPELAPELVRDVLGVALPAYTEARIESGELTDVVPAQRYADKAARTALEALMARGYEYQSEWALRHRAEGEAKGKAEGEVRALLTVLEVRGLAVSSEQRERILGCTDLAQLEAWLRKALVAGSADEFFTG